MCLRLRGRSRCVPWKKRACGQQCERHPSGQRLRFHGTWSDWIDALPKFREAHAMSDDFVVENFSIKAYLVSKS